MRSWRSGLFAPAMTDLHRIVDLHQRSRAPLWQCRLALVHAPDEDMAIAERWITSLDTATPALLRPLRGADLGPATEAELAALRPHRRSGASAYDPRDHVAFASEHAFSPVEANMLAQHLAGVWMHREWWCLSPRASSLAVHGERFATGAVRVGGAVAVRFGARRDPALPREDDDTMALADAEATLLGLWQVACSLGVPWTVDALGVRIRVGRETARTELAKWVDSVASRRGVSLAGAPRQHAIRETHRSRHVHASSDVTHGALDATRARRELHALEQVTLTGAPDAVVYGVERALRAGHVDADVGAILACDLRTYRATEAASSDDVLDRIALEWALPLGARRNELTRDQAVAKLVGAFGDRASSVFVGLDPRRAIDVAQLFLNRIHGVARFFEDASAVEGDITQPLFGLDATRVAVCHLALGAPHRN